MIDPCSPRPAPPPLPVEVARYEPVASPGPEAPVVLVVEDDVAQRAALVRGLGALYTVYQASDGLAALQALGRIPKPAAIVCDSNMPRMDGIAFARALKSHEKLRVIPILMTTARTRPLDVLAGINAGVRHYLPKPVDMRDLLEKMKHDVAAKT